MILLDPIMLVSAVRYALNRHSYVTLEVNREVRRVLPEMPLADLRNIAKDIRAYIETPSKNPDLDFTLWDETLELIEEELAARTTRDQDDTERK